MGPNSLKVIFGFLFQNSRGVGSQLKDSIPIAEFSASGAFGDHDILRRGYALSAC